MQSQYAIGIFDSGMGGLTVLRAMRDLLPQESFIYLGDMARLPYGTKSPSTVRHYAVEMAKILVEKKIKALVVACNTATTASLPYLQSMLPDMPVLGVVAPGAAAAVSATKNQRIGVLATETTIAAKAYHDLISATLPKAFIRSRACSLLVALAEEGMVNNDIARAIISHYIEGFNDVDTILLGCTHFPVFRPLLKTLFSPETNIVDSAESTAQALMSLLEKKQLLKTGGASFGYEKYLVTDSMKRFQQVGELFLGHSISKSDITLVDV